MHYIFHFVDGHSVGYLSDHKMNELSLAIQDKRIMLLPNRVNEKLETVNMKYVMRIQLIEG
jgi:hypothetical protein